MADLKKVCKSALNKKIIAFFQENPQSVDTAHNIAAWLNYDEEQVRKALDYLAAQGILISHRTGSTIAYSYTQDKELISKINRML